jgi:hypothetical protein
MFFYFNVRSPSFAGIVNSNGKFNSIIVKMLKPVFLFLSRGCPFNLKKITSSTRQFISTDRFSLLSTPLTSRWKILEGPEVNFSHSIFSLVRQFHWLDCGEPAISLHKHHVSLVQWTTCLLLVTKDPGSNPQGGT